MPLTSGSPTVHSGPFESSDSSCRSVNGRKAATDWPSSSTRSKGTRSSVISPLATSDPKRSRSTSLDSARARSRMISLAS